MTETRATAARAPTLGLAFAMLAALTGGVAAAAPDTPAPAGGEAVQIGDERYRLGNVTVDLKTKTLTCPGKINLRRCVMEYLAVAPQGKRHESLLLLDVRPLHVQLGLILLGLEPKGGLRFQGDSQVPQGSPVSIWVSWTIKGKTTKVAGEELVWDTLRKKPMEAGSWVFSGSQTDEGGFLGDREKSLIGTFRDPAAIINNGGPGGDDDIRYKPNLRIAPVEGTPVTVTITPARVTPAAHDGAAAGQPIR